LETRVQLALQAELEAPVQLEIKAQLEAKVSKALQGARVPGAL
jgi:hypothetical protein